ncbi:hypothetical protein Pmani_012432 [Petrolisthes manimaculis]|uniref:Uncharacterized protein n=1 Tax=Petrolisthes manimaculis TaxID=1843537 RepID=A0AAE1PY22_9EUCA|nr:hypothetical protein Pmani_012432 [Petrolisthes manimaculis]
MFLIKHKTNVSILNHVKGLLSQHLYGKTNSHTVLLLYHVHYLSRKETMKTHWHLLMFMMVHMTLCWATVDVEDLSDTEEIVLKCDACKIVSNKFVEAFGELHKEGGGTPNDEDIVSVSESVCDDAWEGFGVTIVADEERLSGPGSEVIATEKLIDEDGMWSRRLQDMCDEFLAEINDEKSLYHTWASGNSLEEYICRGMGTFAACVSDDWGPWPGDDYDDYDDAVEFDDIHDEF